MKDLKVKAIVEANTREEAIKLFKANYKTPMNTIRVKSDKEISKYYKEYLMSQL